MRMLRMQVKAKEKEMGLEKDLVLVTVLISSNPDHLSQSLLDHFQPSGHCEHML